MWLLAFPHLYSRVTSAVGITPFKNHTIVFVFCALYCFLKALDLNTNVVSKCSWGGLHISIESEMMSACGGMFGVMTYYHSSIVCHKGSRQRITYFSMTPRSGLYHKTGVRDYRWLIQQFSQFAGRSLVTVSPPGELFVAVLHAAFGRWLSDRTCTANSINQQ
jgi:hypothetical protein